MASGRTTKWLAFAAAISIVSGTGLASAQLETGGSSDADASRELGDDASGSDRRRRDYPNPVATSSDPRRWDPTGMRNAPLKGDRADDESAADVSREEAAALRREAAELQESLDRIEAAQKRRPPATKKDAAAMKRKAEDLAEDIDRLEGRAHELDTEAVELQDKPKSAPGADASEPVEAETKEDVTPPPTEADPLTDDIEDDTEHEDELE